MSRLQLAVGQIVFARKYSLRLLETIPAADWFRQTPGGVTHVGWQVGHLAFAEYRLALWRIRDVQPGDENLFPPNFQSLVSFNSVPVFEAANYPSTSEIRAILDRVHEQALRELSGLSDADMDQPVPHPHPFAKTKLEALLWCASHEMMHAGQIGLLRRHLGHPPM